MLRLTIYHSIHLTREQIYSLHEGNDVITTGVSVPTWFVKKFTSEPAHEVFCKYYLKNPKKEIPIKILEDGYEITLPYREARKYEKTADSGQSDLDDLYFKSIKEISSKNLLDPIDGGCGFLNYRELDKVHVRKKELSIMHYVIVATMDKLIQSIDN